MSVDPSLASALDGIELQMQVQDRAHYWGASLFLRRHKDLCADGQTHEIICPDTGHRFFWFWASSLKGFIVQSAKPNFGFGFSVKNARCGSKYDHIRTVFHTWGDDHLKDYLNAVEASYNR